MSLATLRAVRTWRAALAASLLAFAISMPLGVLLDDLLRFVSRDGLFAVMLAWDLLSLAVVEGCKLAALWWILRRDIESWPALGLAYGVLAWGWSLLRWGLDWLQFPGFVTASPMMALHLATPILFHFLLGLLAVGLARAPGRVWWGWAGASLAGLVLMSWRFWLMQTVPLPESLLLLVDIGPPLSLILFGLAVWRVRRHGPRHLVVLGFGVIAALLLVLGLLYQIVPVAGFRRADPAAALVVALGLCFLAAMVAQQTILRWMRRPGE
ncbi:hypothetical protein ACVFYP_18535 [Roseomonas sp. F4]